MALNPIRVVISDDELKAFLSYDGGPSEPAMSETRLRYLLRGQGVVSGLIEDALASAVSEINTGNKMADFLIAQGTSPQKGENAAMDLCFEISTKPKEDEKGKLDYREIGVIIIVEKDQVLAIKKKAKQAVNGVTVTGKVLLMPDAEDIPLSAGLNVKKEETDDRVIYSAKERGAVKFENNVLSVYPVLDIENDVDFNCGNINFPGNVKIGRDILPDFSVKAEGKVSIWGSAVACRVEALMDVSIRAGIIGKSKGFVKSGASIKVGFIENACVEAETDVIVRSGIIGSTVHCNGFLRVEMRGGRIVESRIQAGHGIVVGNAGSRFSSATNLITGIVGAKEVIWLELKKELEEKMNEVRNLEKRYGRNTLENKSMPVGFMERCQQDFERWETLKTEIMFLHEKIKEIESEMYDYKAVIVIKEQLFPKVTLRIGKFEITTSREYHRVTIRYSPEDARMIIA